jgi:NAD(P)-dependent dehydrogenase (short-subunit alcohol dehydrogenase family)
MNHESGPKDRTALVTGANRGIGLETVRQLCAKGYRVLLGSRDLQKGEKARAGLLPEANPAVVELDVASPKLEEQTEAILKRYERIDVLVNNAGVHYDDWQTPSTVDWKIVREAFETNFFGAWRLAAMLAPPMRDRSWGRIVNVSSEVGALGSLGKSIPAYAISKTALNALTVSMAAEYRNSGVLVNAVCPGWVATDMGGEGGRPVPEGARSVVLAVELPDDGPSGIFLRDGKKIDW